MSCNGLSVALEQTAQQADSGNNAINDHSPVNCQIRVDRLLLLPVILLDHPSNDFSTVLRRPEDVELLPSSSVGRDIVK